MQAVLDHFFSWPAFYLLIVLFTLDLMLDHFFSSLSVFEILPAHIRAYLLSVPLSLAFSFLAVLTVPGAPAMMADLFFLTFGPFVLLTACYYKDKLSDLSDDEDYESHWLMKFGLLIGGLAIMILLY